VGQHGYGQQRNAHHERAVPTHEHCPVFLPFSQLLFERRLMDLEKRSYVTTKRIRTESDNR
jgi:hypothetical protein